MAGRSVHICGGYAVSRLWLELDGAGGSIYSQLSCEVYVFVS